MGSSLTNELREAGFPLKEGWVDSRECHRLPNLHGDIYQSPILEEILAELGKHEVYFFGNGSIGYKAWVGDTVVQGATAVEVAAKLWLALNKK